MINSLILVLVKQRKLSVLIYNIIFSFKSIILEKNPSTITLLFVLQVLNKKIKKKLALKRLPTEVVSSGILNKKLEFEGSI